MKFASRIVQKNEQIGSQLELPLIDWTQSELKLVLPELRLSDCNFNPFCGGDARC